MSSTSDGPSAAVNFSATWAVPPLRRPVTSDAVSSGIVAPQLALSAPAPMGSATFPSSGSLYTTCGTIVDSRLSLRANRRNDGYAALTQVNGVVKLAPAGREREG